MDREHVIVTLMRASQSRALSAIGFRILAYVALESDLEGWIESTNSEVASAILVSPRSVRLHLGKLIARNIIYSVAIPSERRSLCIRPIKDWW